MKDELKQILNEIVESIRELHNKDGFTPVSSDMILDCAVRIYNSQQINKNQSQGKFSSPSLVPDPNALATEKQIHLIKNLNIPYHAGMTKKDANKLISEKLGK